MRVKIILVEPKYQVNLGYVARTAMNLGVKRLYIVNPRAKVSGEKARMYAKHAHGLLETAKIYKSLDDATRGCALIVGTTGIREKAKANFRRIYFAEDAVERISKIRGGKTVALLMGRDDIGLTNEEIEKCDMLAYISSDPQYPVLNISHALAILLYLLQRKRLRTYSEIAMEKEDFEETEMKTLFSMFGKLIAGKKIRNRKAVMGIFRRTIRNAQLGRQELHALITALK